MVKYFLVLSTILFLTQACVQKKYAREKELLAFIENELQMELNRGGKEYLIFLLQTHICSACIENYINLITELNEDYNCIIILSSNNNEVVNLVKNKNIHAKLFIGNLDLISSYGLASYESEFINITNNKVVDWVVMDSAKLDQIKKVYL